MMLTLLWASLKSFSSIPLRTYSKTWSINLTTKLRCLSWIVATKTATLGISSNFAFPTSINSCLKMKSSFSLQGSYMMIPMTISKSLDGSKSGAQGS